jgi:hypothetical protein
VRDLDSGDCIRACIRGLRRGLGEIALTGRTTVCALAWFLCGLLDLGEMVRGSSFRFDGHEFPVRQVAAEKTVQVDFVRRHSLQSGAAR